MKICTDLFSSGSRFPGSPYRNPDTFFSDFRFYRLGGSFQLIQPCFFPCIRIGRRHTAAGAVNSRRCTVKRFLRPGHQQLFSSDGPFGDPPGLCVKDNGRFPVFHLYYVSQNGCFQTSSALLLFLCTLFLKHKLLPEHRVSFWCPPLIFFEHHRKIQGIIGIRIHGFRFQRKPKFCFLIRFRFQVLHTSALYGTSVLFHPPEKLIFFHIFPAEPVDKRDLFRTPRLLTYLNRRLLNFQFQSTRMRFQIRGQNSIQTHIRGGIHHVFVKISSISPVWFSCLIPIDQGLVRQRPDKSPLKSGVISDTFPEFPDISVAVSLGIGIFTHDHRTAVRRILYLPGCPFQIRIHRNTDIADQ